MITIWEMNGIMNAGGTESLIMEIFRHKTDAVNYKLIAHYPCKPESGMFDNEISQIGIPIEYLPSVGSVGYRKYEQALNSLIKRIGKPDVVHIHMNAVGGLIAKACRNNGIDYRIIHCHADIRYRGSNVQNFISECKLAIMKGYVRKYGTSFWACSEEAAKRLFGSLKARVIPNCIDVEKYIGTAQKKKERRKKYGFDEEAYVIGAIGRVAKIKSYETMIQALPLVIDLIPNAHFVCFGRADDTGYYNDLQALANRLKVEQHVHFMGNSTEVNEDIQLFDCFVMPSVTEGFGMAALEAQAAGLRTIVSSGVPEGVDMGLGLVSRQTVGDVDGWAKELSKRVPCCVDKHSILHAFAQKGYSAVSEVRKIEKMYTEMVGNNK